MGAGEKRDRRLHVGTADISAAVEKASLSRTARPDPEVVERPVRRTFTAEFKRRVVEESGACREAGEVGALLRQARAVLVTSWRGGGSGRPERWRAWRHGSGAARRRR